MAQVDQELKVKAAEYEVLDNSVELLKVYHKLTNEQGLMSRGENTVYKGENLTAIQEEGYESVLIQGSGTFGIESVISSVVGKNDVLLILANGAYGERIAKMAIIHQLNHHVVRFEEDEIVTAEATEVFLQAHPDISM